MRGYVHTINRRRGLLAIAAEGGWFTIVALLDNTPANIGDQMEWAAARALGSQVYTNHTKGTRATVVVQRHGVPAGEVRERLGL